MHKILITDDIGPAGLALLDAANDMQYDVVKLPPREKLIEIIDEYEAVITRSGTPLLAGTFEAAQNLKVAGRAGVGMDNVDIDAATLRGVLVMNTPEATTLAAVELTMTLLLAVCRHLPLANASIKNGEWTRARFLGTQLSEKTLGVIGLRRIGSRVATRCQAFGMKVIAYDPYLAEEVAERIHVHLVADLEELLSRSDIITVHTPLTEETRHLIGAREIAQMKDGVILIYCARGGIYDEQALCDALASGKVTGAGLDVYSREPPGNDPLLMSQSSNITVVSYNGIVLLVGQVANESLKQLAGERARVFENARSVHNELEVMAPLSMVARANDSWLTTKIKSQMFTDAKLVAGKIKVVTVNGVVFLMGMLPREEADRAVEVARSVYGVQKIVKVFEYVQAPPATHSGA